MKAKRPQARRREKIHGRVTSVLALIIALYVTMPPLSYADSSGSGDFFIPDSMYFYNPLKHSEGVEKNSIQLSTTGLDNEALIAAAAHFRNNDMNTTQRVLNYQWLHQQHHNRDLRYGTKVLSQLFKMGFKTYWKSVRYRSLKRYKVVPDANGRGSLVGDLDYNVKFSSNRVKVTFKYEF